MVLILFIIARYMLDLPIKLLNSVMNNTGESQEIKNSINLNVATKGTLFL